MSNAVEVWRLFCCFVVIAVQRIKERIQVKEEFNLKDLTEMIWKGKVIIASVTIFSLLVAVISNFFVLSPTYEARSTVRVEMQAREGTNPPGLSSFVEAIRADVAIKRIINKLELDSNQYTINSVRNAIQTNLINGTNVIEVKVTGHDPKMITDIANLAVFELGARMEISDRSVEIVQLRSRLEELGNLIRLNQAELAVSQKQLQNTPEKLITKKSLADEPYLHSIMEDNVTTSGKKLGTLELVSEEINPLYTSLTAKVADLMIQLSMLEEEKKTNERTIANYQEIINTLETRIDRELLNSENSTRLLDGFSAIFISPAIKPVDPVGPSKIKNIFITVMIGFMLSISIVAVRHSWRVNGGSKGN